MFEHVSIDVLANWIVMLRTDVGGAILLSDDDQESRFYEICANEEARVVPAPHVALPLLDRAEKLGVRGLVAVFRGVVPRQSPNIFCPSLGDIVSLFLLSKNCDRVVRDICGGAWFAASEKEVGPIRCRVIWLALVVERLRRACTQAGVDPRPLEFSEIIDWNKLDIAWAALTPLLVSKGVTRDALDKIRLAQQSGDLRSDLLEFDGMQAVLLFAAASRMYRPHGIIPVKEVEPLTFVSMLRMAFDLREFEDDKVFWQMRRWERANSRYPLLRAWRATDPLGVVLDQRYWESDLAAIITTLQPGEPLAMFKIDLDNFKQVNEQLGHGAGDEAIRVYCRIVLSVLGAVGEVYRRGGDEVVVLAPGLGDPEARELAETVRIKVEETFRRWSSERGLQKAPTASIGLAISTELESAHQVAKLADEAQGLAKEQGKNRTVVLP